ncbi:hypothetical protein [Lentzea sp. NPDC051838]|uniref:hypothetical protein n=1 Tax=Lentzea sp. NPDC051838 TaxID=3154849 RepID=UPI003420C090
MCLSDVDVARLPVSPDLDVVARAIGGVVTALVTLTDPQVVVLGGPWGPSALDAVVTACDRLPRHVVVAAASVSSPSFVGAQAHALEQLRAALVSAARPR